ncbi:MAG: Penicillin-binding protein transpeptidase [Parcubacteria group bacterium GW2011_GWA2_51_10]|nr:MAG: Penicillin-binding protein transpeptidase [Parcubacteria group bacterium GW2011_GWA2_51_10]
MKRSKKIHEIAPDEIFLDSSNLPSHNQKQFEGRVERPVAARRIIAVGLVFAAMIVTFSARSFNLQVTHGSEYSEISRNNRLERSIIFASRGIIYDREGRELAWNEAREIARSVPDVSGPDERNVSAGATSSRYALRRYTELPGLAHVLGFVRYPKADESGAWWREEYTGVSGVELAFDSTLRGANGSTMVETDALGNIARQDITVPPKEGVNVTLSIDSEVQSRLFAYLSAHAERQGFQGGASVIMDVETGELLALASFPEYDNDAFTAGDAASVRAARSDSRTPLLNRAIAGAYTPGSIVKPIFAAAALNEGIISPEKEILSTGAITIPNPYDPEKPSVYRDWTVHGLVDMRTALAVSSDEYFYTIGGGYGGQQGLGIRRLDEYARLFGLGSTTGIALLGEVEGIIPTPEWKEKIFGADDPWRIGNTYHTVIGQYGFQMTPLQAARFVAAIANGGRLLLPHIRMEEESESVDVDIPDEYLEIVRDGMRMAVTSTRHDATVKALNISGIQIAAKTGTAQIGARNEAMNSWSVGFWPANNPRFAYATVLERAPAGTLSGAAPAMLPFFQWLIANKPQYVN